MFWIIGDDNRDRKHIPVLTYLLLALNIFIYVSVQECGANTDAVTGYGIVPQEILTGEDIIQRGWLSIEDGKPVRLPALTKSPTPTILTLLTSMVLHGGLLHLLFNMLYLYIFADNVEDAFGRVKFLILYIVCGIAAGLTHVGEAYFTSTNLYIPTIGASGAISGMMGSYVVLYPKKRVTVLFLLFIRWRIPALIVVGTWFILQSFSFVDNLASVGAGVAYGAHIGGFICGALCGIGYRIRHHKRGGYVLRHP